MYTIQYFFGSKTVTNQIASRDAVHMACREAKRDHVTKIIVHDPFDRWFVWTAKWQNWTQMVAL